MLQWADVLKDKSLQNLPYKVELDRRGKIILTPISNKRGAIKVQLGARLGRIMRDGRILLGCSIETLDGVKVADVAYLSKAFLKKHHYETPYSAAPEICVEVISPSNSQEELTEKITLYLAKGAREVWTCDEKGNVTFYDHSGEIKKSKLVARFPAKI